MYTVCILYCTILYYTVLYCTVHTILYILYYTILYCIILYCTVLYYTVQYILYCTILYYTILYCTILYYIYTVLYNTVLYCTVLYYTILYCTVHIILYHTVLYYTVLYCTILYYTVLYSTYYTVPYCTILYCTVLYYTTCILYCTILYCTVLLVSHKLHVHVFINHYRFDTSYSLLRILLEDQSKKTITSPTWLPIVKLWPSLIAAACDLTGEERIKLIGLLLQVLCLNSKIGSTNGASVAAGVQKLDLTLLKPLWSLYTTMSKEYGVI